MMAEYPDVPSVDVIKKLSDAISTLSDDDVKDILAAIDPVSWTETRLS